MYESSTQFKVIGLQLGLVYVSWAAHKEDRGLTVGRRYQLKVLAVVNNLKGNRNKKKPADCSHRIAHKWTKRLECTNPNSVTQSVQCVFQERFKSTQTQHPNTARSFGCSNHNIFR
jgi:hypothetical protein